MAIEATETWPLYSTLAAITRKQAGGDLVYCRKCGRRSSCDHAKAFRHGWPKCCGCTMTIDRPEDAPDAD